MFRQGDTVIHPVRGAGIVTCVGKRRLRGATDQYYTIDLLDGLGTRLMIPVSAEHTLGLRPGIKASQLHRIWRVLAADPRQLPADYKKRNKLVDERLSGGDTIELAAVVRDLADRERQQGELTIVTKRHLRKGLAMLSGEIAAALDMDLDDAEVLIRARLRAEPCHPAIA
jgi:CarD family transcriptional regulator